MNVTFKKTTKANVSLGDRGREHRTSAKYAVIVDGAQVGTIENTQRDRRYMALSDWRFLDMRGIGRIAGRDTLKEAKAAVVRHFER